MFSCDLRTNSIISNVYTRTQILERSGTSAIRLEENFDAPQQIVYADHPPAYTDKPGYPPAAAAAAAGFNDPPPSYANSGGSPHPQEYGFKN